MYSLTEWLLDYTNLEFNKNNFEGREWVIFRRNLLRLYIHGDLLTFRGDNKMMNVKAFEAERFATNHYLKLLNVRPTMDLSPSKK